MVKQARRPLPGWQPGLLALGVVVSACASGSSSRPDEGRAVGGTTEVRVGDSQTGTDRLRYQIEEDKLRYEAEFPIQRVWPALVQAFTELGLEPDLVDPPGGRIGMVNQLVSRSTRFAGERPAEYLDCGTTLTGPIANVSRIRTTFMITATALPDSRTRLLMEMDAAATLNDAAHSDPRRCRSTRKLEARLMEDVYVLLAGLGGA